jgi:hypothetical protein
MNKTDNCGVGILKLTSASAAGTIYLGSFDTSGYDSANIFLASYNDSAGSSGFVSSLYLTESDTVTSASSQTAIVAFTGGTATSTSVGFVITKNTSADSIGAIELQVDLRKRKRYLGLYAVADAGSTNFIGGIALFGKPEQSKDTYSTKVVTNNESTLASILQVVTG